MDRQFTGTYPQKVDAKGRVAVPAPFRRVLDANNPDMAPGGEIELLMVFGPRQQQYLDCYSIAESKDISAEITAMERGTKKRRKLEYLYSGCAVRTSLDGTGRLLIPEHLREKIGLGTDALFVASGPRFHIWDPQRFETLYADPIEAMFDSDDPVFDPMSVFDDD